MNFKKLVKNILDEEVVAGGESSVFGSSVEQGYEKNTEGDNRIPYSVYGGVLTRKGTLKPRKKRKKKKTRQ